MMLSLPEKSPYLTQIGLGVITLICEDHFGKSIYYFVTRIYSIINNSAFVKLITAVPWV